MTDKNENCKAAMFIYREIKRTYMLKGYEQEDDRHVQKVSLSISLGLSLNLSKMSSVIF